MVTNVFAFSFALSSLLLFVSPPSLATLSYFSYANLSSSSSNHFTAVHFENILRRFYAAVSPSKMEASARNGGISKVFSANQFLCFFDQAKLSTAARRSTSVTGI